MKKADFSFSQVQESSQKQLYVKSLVLATLQETLQDLTQDTFIRQDIATKILKIACEIFHKNLKQIINELPNLGISGHLLFYRHVRESWTLYIRDAQIQIFPPSITPFPIITETTQSVKSINYSDELQINESKTEKSQDGTGEEAQKYDLPSLTMKVSKKSALLAILTQEPRNSSDFKKEEIESFEPSKKRREPL